MVIRVIDPNPHKSVVKEVICRNCGATLEYTPADVQSYTHHDYGGGSDVVCYIPCPQCQNKQTVRSF